MRRCKILVLARDNIINVDKNRMLSLTVKVLFSYSHFQNLRENAYSYVKFL